LTESSFSHAVYQLAADAADAGIWEWDLRTNVLQVSDRWRALLGLTEHGSVEAPQDWFDSVHPDDVAGLESALNRHVDGRSRRFVHEHRAGRPGGWRWISVCGVAERDEHGHAFRMAGTIGDVTPRVEAEQKLTRLALFDDLTGLANRTLFVSRLAQVSRRAQRRAASRFAVLFVDLDRFKLVNDSLGHVAGDELLVAVARRLESCVRPGDTVARIGGDEFAVLLEDLSEDTGAVTAADRIHNALGVPVWVRGQAVFTSASIGIADGSGRQEPEELLRHADLAMYGAKRQGRARSEQYCTQLDGAVLDELQLETKLRRALQEREFVMHYQPIFDLHTREITGLEALARWNGPPDEYIGPDVFVPFAEDRGFMAQLGLQLIRRGCIDTAVLQRHGNAVPVNINLSARQFREDDLVEQIELILLETGCDPSGVVFELTETALLESPEKAGAMLDRLRSLGARIHLDDFGTGYSSLGLLQRLRIDAVKIDQSFIARLTGSAEGQVIVSAILGLARNLGMGVVAEGIETLAQLDRLRLLGCDRGQGYFFSPAVEFSRVREMLDESVETVRQLHA
jgi:diguanylate cyclase (GGDEF)-like protein/PAS domain S-box-containing protein